jgi:hypothetical protein
MAVLAPVHRTLDRLADLRARYFLGYAFVHINKTGGSSIEQALGLPFQHKTAVEMRDEIGARRWAGRFTFSVVRNPWDRAVSHYYYRIQTNQTGLRDRPIPFGDWVEGVYAERDPRYYDKPRMFMPQLHWLLDENDRIMVSAVARFETLREDFGEICRLVRRPAQLPHLKSSRRPHYREAYTDRSAELVARWFAEDIEEFGYSF